MSQQQCHKEKKCNAAMK